MILGGFGFPTWLLIGLLIPVIALFGLLVYWKLQAQAAIMTRLEREVARNGWRISAITSQTSTSAIVEVIFPDESKRRYNVAFRNMRVSLYWSPLD